MKTPSILADTVRMLNECDLPMAKVQSDTGLSLRWLYMLARGELKDPGVTKIERLRDYLKSLGVA